MSSPFPLLRLPRLVLFDVFKSLSIGEKIKLSLCSKKIFTLINNDRLHSPKVILYLDMAHQVIRVYSENYFQIGIYLDRDIDNDREIQQWQIKGCTVPVTTDEPTKVNTFWKDLVEGFLCVTQHLMKIFQCKISTGKECWRNGLFQPILSELFDQKLEFEKITVGLHESVDHNWLNRIFFSNLGLVEELEISDLLIIPSSFIPIFPAWPRQKITIKSNASWLTLDTLFTCTCSHIHISNTNLKNKELNEILTYWMAGGLPNLEYLRIGSTKFKWDGDHILGMVPNEWEDQHTIQTDDGSKTAEVQLYQCNLKLLVFQS
ncbi:hypothetical protein CRE_24740 [Caenorhabditis remanei]|uniref:F-box domain-containing protein n=1 Tax=Caenorhabditis remanei TaxID=31234 RepID=E3N951_CAERE|nr:hypothetical protein CRE_24740 [Caenorhabditis remanei]